MSNWPCNALILGKQPHSKLKWLRDIWNIKALPNQRGQPWKSLLQTHVFSTIRLSTCTNANPSKGTWTGWPAHKGEMTCLARAGGTGVERKRKGGLGTPSIRRNQFKHGRAVGLDFLCSLQTDTLTLAATYACLSLKPPSIFISPGGSGHAPVNQLLIFQTWSCTSVKSTELVCPQCCCFKQCFSKLQC